MIIVLAGNYNEYLDYLKLEGLNHEVAIYVDRPENFLGLEYSEKDVVMYGTFKDRRDANTLHRDVMRHAKV